MILFSQNKDFCSNILSWLDIERLHVDEAGKNRFLNRMLRGPNAVKFNAGENITQMEFNTSKT